MEKRNFTHLHVHTGYSFLDGMCRIDELIDRTKSFKMTALAITDHNHIGGTYEFQTKCIEAGIKPILGYEAYYNPDTLSISMTPEERKEGAAKKALALSAINQDEYNVFVLGKKVSKISKKSVEAKISAYMPDLRQYHVIFLAQNQNGWENIIRLQSESARLCTYRGRFTCNDTLIEKYSDGVICTTACIASKIARLINNEENYEAAEKFILNWQRIFSDRLYLEMQPLLHKDQIRVNAFLIKMSKQHGIPLIITNDVHYIAESDHNDHDTLLCIGTGHKKSYNGPGRMRYSNEFWFRSYDEMLDALIMQQRLDHEEENILPPDYLEVCKNALEETNRLAGRISSSIKIGSDIPLIPKVKLENEEKPENVLIKRCFYNLYKLAQNDSYVKKHLLEYEERLHREIEVINPKGFASYILAVDEYVTWANKNGCMTGPGRGSAAGSLALYLLGVTKNTDPMKYGLLFERFLTKDRTALPDIDTDFDYYHRDDVIKHLEDYYGKECVCHIGTYTASGVKSGIKDVCRVLDISFSESNNISKVLDEINDTPQPKFSDYDNLKNNENPGDLAKWERFNSLEKKYSEVFRLARKFEGLKRNFGVHASGILVMPIEVNKMIPTRTADGISVSLYTGPEIEELNGVKVDILGLKTVSVIVNTIKRIGITIDELYSRVKTDDPKVFKMLSEGRSDAVFQLESDLFKSALKLIKPTDINDIVAITAALRPGPLSLQSHIHYAKRKNGEEKITYPLKNTEHIFKDTYGLALYQEQLMKVSVDCFGFNQNQADSLTRKILAKKKKDKMAMLRRMFIYGKKNVKGPEGWEDNPDLPWYDESGTHYGDEISGGLAKGYTLDELEKFNNDIEAYASYLFNLSHSVSYSYISVLTAYLKCYYPVEFMAAVLSIQSDEKIDRYAKVCQDEGIDIITPDINVSDKDFTPDGDNNRIYYGLSSIKGVGEKVIEEIIAARLYESLEDIFERLPKKTFNKRVAVALAKAGALDSFSSTKNRYEVINKIYELRKDKDEKFNADDYDEEACIEFEKEVLSASITYKPWWSEVRQGERISESAKILSFTERPDKRGNAMGFMKLRIRSCEIEALMFSSKYLKCIGAFDEALNPKKVITVTGKKDDKGKLILDTARL